MSDTQWAWGGVSKMLNEMHECLLEKYHPGAFAWADKTLDNAWTTAVNRFEKAITLASKINDPELFQLEMEFYKTKCLDLFNRYKAINNKAAVETYLESLRTKGEGKS